MSGPEPGCASGIRYPELVRLRCSAETSSDEAHASESDPGPYPIPSNVKIEGGSDRHALLVDRDNCRLYQLYALQRKGGATTPAP